MPGLDQQDVDELDIEQSEQFVRLEYDPESTSIYKLRINALAKVLKIITKRSP